MILASALENIHAIIIQNTSELSIPMSLTAMLKNVEDGFPKMIGSTPVENWSENRYLRFTSQWVFLGCN